MKKPNWIDADKDKMHGKEFFTDMEKEFPEFAEELNWYEDDLIHPKMEVFSRYTKQQIKDGNDKELIRCFNFLEERLEKIDSELENAIYVSYCETLLLENKEDTMKQKRKLMFKKLKWYYDDYEKYYMELLKESKEK
jgi:hypothetical protein